MPYFIVETSDALGKKELLAAPEAWVEMKKGKPYLHWPNVRNISSLNTLLADDRSVPSMMWEKHECDILRRNILSLALAAKSIEQLKARAETRASTSKNVPTHKPAAPAATSTKQTKITVGSIAPNPSLSEKVFHIANVDGSANPLSQRETESASTERPSSKMFGDLRDLIDKNQKEMDAKMTQGFQRLHRMLGAIKMRQKEPQNRTVSSTDQPDTAAQVFEEINIKNVTTVEEMNELEERLSDEEYRKQVQHWIDCTVGYEMNAEARMMTILDLLIDKDFLPNFSWTGVSRNGVKKYSFAQYPQICRLFQYAGTTKQHRADLVFVSSFFMKKLKYALYRAENYKALRRSVPHATFTKRKKEQVAEEHDYTNDDVHHLKISKVEQSQDNEMMEEEEEEEAAASGSTSYGRMSISIEGLDYSPVADYEETDYDSIVAKKSPGTPPTLFMSAEDESE